MDQRCFVVPVIVGCVKLKSTRTTGSFQICIRASEGKVRKCCTVRMEQQISSVELMVTVYGLRLVALVKMLPV